MGIRFRSFSPTAHFSARNRCTSAGMRTLSIHVFSAGSILRIAFHFRIAEPEAGRPLRFVGAASRSAFGARCRRRGPNAVDLGLQSAIECQTARSFTTPHIHSASDPPQVTAIVGPRKRSDTSTRMPDRGISSSRML